MLTCICHCHCCDCLLAEINACIANPCQSNGTGGAATCSDLPYPAPDSAAGRTCGCSKATSTYTDDVTGCVDIDACASFPCNQTGAGGAASCADVAEGLGGAAGRTCTCANGFAYNDPTGCPIVGKLTLFKTSMGHFLS